MRSRKLDSGASALRRLVSHLVVSAQHGVRHEPAPDIAEDALAGAVADRETPPAARTPAPRCAGRGRAVEARGSEPCCSVGVAEQLGQAGLERLGEQLPPEWVGAGDPGLGGATIDPSGGRNARVRCVGRLRSDASTPGGRAREAGRQPASDRRSRPASGRRSAHEGSARRRRHGRQSRPRSGSHRRARRRPGRRGGRSRRPRARPASRTTGRRCSATRRLLLVEDELLEVVGRTLGGGFHGVVLDHLARSATSLA